MLLKNRNCVVNSTYRSKQSARYSKDCASFACARRAIEEQVWQHSCRDRILESFDDLQEHFKELQ
jgi:hypothetical protein